MLEAELAASRAAEAYAEAKSWVNVCNIREEELEIVGAVILRAWRLDGHLGVLARIARLEHFNQHDRQVAIRHGLLEVSNGRAADGHTIIAPPARECLKELILVVGRTDIGRSVGP